MIADLLTEVFDALFHVIGNSFRAFRDRRRNKKSGLSKDALPAVNGIPPQS